MMGRISVFLGATRTMRSPLGAVLFVLVLLGAPRLASAYDHLFAVPVVRPNVGGSWVVNDGSEPGVAFHAPVGAMLGWSGSGLGRLLDSTPFLLPEIGYELRSTTNHRSDVFSAGFGVGYGIFAFAIVSYTPRFLVGRSDGQTAVGFRHSIAGHFLLSVVYLELSHQVLRAGGVTNQDIQLCGGLNLGTLLIPSFW